MNATPGLISVIIPVYQGETFVMNAVKSALNQTHDNLEIIVIDDGSTDGTWPLLQSIKDDRVKVFHQANAGVSVARNFGLQHSTGKYIAFLDADDLWLSDKLEHELACLTQRQHAVGIAYSWYYCVDDEGMLSKKSPRIRYAGDVLQHLLNASPFIIPSASLFDRKVFDGVGAFDTTRRYHEDFAFILRACKQYPAFPTLRYSAIYKQSMSGKARRIMNDYDGAVRAALSISEELHGILTDGETQRLRLNLSRELYFRFLMYGFNSSASRLLASTPVSALPGGAKGWLGWFYAKTRLNLMMPGRRFVQGFSKLFGRRRWRRFLERSGLAASE